MSTPTSQPVRPAMPSQTTLVGVILRREIMVKLRDKTFIWSTVFLLVVIGASAVIPLLLQQGNERPSITVATVGDLAGTVAHDAARAGKAAKVDDPSGVPAATITVRPVADRAAAEALVRSGEVDAALVSTGTTAELVADEEVPDKLDELITRSLSVQRLAAELDDPARAATLLAQAPPKQQLLNPPAKDADLALFLGFAFGALFSVTTIIFGVNIAQSVVEEKQSRVVELLVAAVPVRLLLLGKVLGSSLLALGQLTLLLAVGLAGASAAGQSGVVSLLLDSSGWFVLFFLVGFATLGCLWAGAGAVASRQEDLQATTFPIQMVVMIPYFVTAYITSGPWQVALSYVPFTSTVMMPRRLLSGQAAWWEALLSASISLAVCGVLIMIGSRLYGDSLLRSAGRVPWKAAWAGRS